MSRQPTQDGTTLDRRALLAGLSAAATMGLAGCGGSGDGEPDEPGGPGGGGGGGGDGEGPELGERVPKLNIDFYTGVGDPYESNAELSVQALEEHLGLTVDATPRDVPALVFDLYADKRTSLLPLYTFIYEVDPHFPTRRMAANQAGDGIGPAAGQNIMQWANCDFSVRAYDQAGAVDTAERHRLVDEAWSILSHDVAIIPYAPDLQVYGIRTDQLDPDLERMRALATTPQEFESFFHIEPVESGTPLTLTGTTSAPFDILNPFTYQSTAHWHNQVVNSPLLRLDENTEIQNNLARSVEFENDGKRVLVEVKPDANFHDGSPVTAEDVKFTYDYMSAGARAGQHTFAPVLPPLQGISEVDEKTVQFDLDQAYVPLTTREMYTWGIQNKAVWMEQLSSYGVDTFDSHESDFDKFGEVAVPPDEIQGSGPFMLENFVDGQSVTFTAWDDHPTLSPAMDFELIRMLEKASRLASLQTGEVNVAVLDPAQAKQLEDEETIAISTTPQIMHAAWMGPNCAAPPTMFKEFRQAVAASFNRRDMADVVYLGQVEPEMYAVLFSQSHPWRHPDDMLYKMAKDETGNPEMARAFLEDAGWGWDDNGNLRYPADKDLEPMWGEGGTPDPDNYPCLTDEGYVRPEGYELSDDQVPGYTTGPTDAWPEGFSE